MQDAVRVCLTPCARAPNAQEVSVLRGERDAVGEEEDRMKREYGKLKQQMGRWASSLNGVFKV